MRISEKIPSKLEIVPEFVSALIGKIKTLSIGEDEVFDIKLSLEEALINAIKHGNKMNPSFYVEVYLEIKDHRLTIKVKDQGEGFDFKNLPDPTTDENLEKPSGRGIFLIKSLMDEFEFFDCGRGIKMVKFVKKGGALR